MVEQCYYQNVVYVVVKKLRFVKEQETSELLSILDIKTSLTNILLLGKILF